MSVNNVGRELKLTDDAIESTLDYLKTSVGLTARQEEKVLTLMRLSYRRGLLMEGAEHYVTKNLIENC